MEEMVSEGMVALRNSQRRGLWWEAFHVDTRPEDVVQGGWGLGDPVGKGGLGFWMLFLSVCPFF